MKRVACEAAFVDHHYPSQELVRELAKQDNMTVSQVTNWFINKRRRTGTSEIKKPGITADYRVIIDWLVAHPLEHPSHELKKQWGELLGKTATQIGQWISNIKKPLRKNALISRGMVSITSGVFQHGPTSTT